MQRNYCLLLGLSVALLPISFTQAKRGSRTDLSTAMRRLAEHINETSTLNADQIKQQTEIIRTDIDLIGQTSEIISEALDLVASYDTTAGPLFMNRATRGGFPRQPAGGLKLDRAMFAIQLHPGILLCLSHGANVMIAISWIVYCISMLYKVHCFR